MSLNIANKLIDMRESERLNRRQFSDLVDIPYSTLSSYETRSKGMSIDSAMKILSHPRFLKYTMWFMTGEVAPEVGQIAPALAHCGQEITTSSHSEKKTG
ncbi:helix-turn-helix domain-containing protein [Providencia alcalifaciens]|uniref:helix-turn-helix domain-containing protein n=1 Tax=Providencia alcalifaciens TaxID=126385 RepID=UPI000447C4FC|nr:helix-turn-helix transcriptional regulator [Providencia alcalifaciens]EUC93777.1 repressor protein C family protein [Providencia alcalifaciens PAL-2]CAG9412409.1 hypothetical protein NVI2019_KOLGMIGM_00852 [Providencia alcalifaciens]CAG9413372.1 hypothetical protein NVI2019_OGMBKCAO_00851 [Providencia alcalifaciens]CAG9413520.1 hypothetical protein NVI2019_ANGEOOBF_00851 [Providencia alcalifaciens]CAG9428593.1 hypothetical protein NVI2019_PLFLNFOB_02965 [Providencia alcalifaciens]